METGLVWLRPRRARHECGAGDGAVEGTELPKDLEREDYNQEILTLVTSRGEGLYRERDVGQGEWFGDLSSLSSLRGQALHDSGGAEDKVKSALSPTQSHANLN